MNLFEYKRCLTWGAVAAVAGAMLLMAWPTLFHLYLHRIMVLNNGTMAFTIWEELPVPVYTELYLYNITNVDDILAGKKVKLRVQQMGPYVYRERQKKVNIVWNENGTVSYQTRRLWHFQPDRSNGSLSDIITNINPIIPSLEYIMRKEPYMLRALVNTLAKMYYSNMFLSANASSWLFDGIENNVLSISKKIPNFPYYVPFDRFGWLYTRNGSADYEGWFVVNTGVDDFSRLGKVELWKHSNQTVFPGSCGEVGGSTGELWSPEKGLPEISMFASDLYRKLTLAASGPVTIGGIEGMMFVSNESLFDNGQKYPQMACYCEDIYDECMLSGVMDASACSYGAPVFVSLPHFRHVHPYYADKIDGMNPSEDDDFKMAIEMVSGMPLMAKAQIQVNYLVRHSTWLIVNNQLPDPDVLVPMVWVREHVLVDDSYASFGRLLLNIYYIMPYAFYLLTGLGVAIFSAGLWNLIYSKGNKRRKEIAEARKLLKQNSCNSNCQ